MTLPPPRRLALPRRPPPKRSAAHAAVIATTATMTLRWVRRRQFTPATSRDRLAHPSEYRFSPDCCTASRLARAADRLALADTPSHLIRLNLFSSPATHLLVYRTQLSSSLRTFLCAVPIPLLVSHFLREPSFYRADGRPLSLVERRASRPLNTKPASRTRYTITAGMMVIREGRARELIATSWFVVVVTSEGIVLLLFGKVAVDLALLLAPLRGSGRVLVRLALFERDRVRLLARLWASARL